MSWQDDEIVKTSWQDDPVVEPAKERTTAESLKRAAGLTARYAAKGLTAIPMAMLDAGVGIGNKINEGTNALGLTTAAPYPLPSQSTDRLLDQYLPKPEGGGEEFSGAVSQAVAGGAPLLAGAQRVASTAQSVPPIVKSMAARPGVELATTATGAGASETARQMGAPEWAQMAAGAVTPLPINAAVGATKATGRAAKEAARPLTHKGAEQIAADVIGRTVSDKETALRNLNHYAAAKELEKRSGGKVTVGVPDSKPTAGAVAADYGLIGGEQLLKRGDESADFARRQAQNNQARIADLARIDATDTKIADFAKRRDQITKPMREAAFSDPSAVVDYGRVEGLISALRNSAAGGKQESARALDTLSKWIQERKAQGRLSPEDAYALHQDIGDLIKGKVQDDKGAIRLAGGMATSIKRELADSIHEVSPWFRRYLSVYSRLSKPIERLEILKDKLGGQALDKVTSAMPQATPDGASYTLSQAKLREVRKAIDREMGEAGLKLAPRQRDILRRVQGDLDADTLASRGGKQPGSDTYQNMASANLFGRTLGQGIAESGAGKMIRGPINLAYRPLESRIRDIIAEAYQDPEKMAKLLRMARTDRSSLARGGLFDAAVAPSTAGLLGSILAQ